MSIAETNTNFIEEIIEHDLATAKHTAIYTRFPPEPNGYLHIGHAKSICLNFGLQKKYKGKTNLRFDDTNPTTEEVAYINSIQEDVKWLGFTWDKLCYTSDYFETLYEYAHQLIEKGLAYVDDTSFEQINKERGVPTLPGIESKYRNRSVEENKKLFTDMRAGIYQNGEKVLRAKIDMASPNMHFRDPILYRIKKESHHRTGDAWCIYPSYDFAHGQSDALEKITHSICTLEFSPHRPLYEWFIDKLGLFPSKQYEFARLNLTYCVLSKRKLLQLVEEKKVDAWDDPRMPTISGMRNRGYTAEAIRHFCEKIGVQKRDSLIDYGLLEFCVRDHLNQIAHRRMVVFEPLKVTLTNFDQKEEWLEAENNPENTNDGSRKIPLTKEIYIEQEDFVEIAPSKKFFRLSLGSMVRLKHAYIIRCDEVVRNANGDIQELKCTIIPNSKSGEDTSTIKVKCTLHWVSVPYATPIDIHIFDRLFSVENPSQEEDFLQHINPQSHILFKNALAEPSILELSDKQHFQFLRKGYFFRRNQAGKPTFNQVVSLKDNWDKKDRE